MDYENNDIYERFREPTQQELDDFQLMAGPISESEWNDFAFRNGLSYIEEEEKE
jgi:hypothetical protein